MIQEHFKRSWDPQEWRFYIFSFDFLIKLRLSRQEQ